MLQGASYDLKEFGCHIYPFLSNNCVLDPMLLCTLFSIFFLIYYFGFTKWAFSAGISSGRNSPLNFQGSPASTGTTEGGLISVQLYPNPPASISNGPGSESPKYVTDLCSTNLHLLQFTKK